MLDGCGCIVSVAYLVGGGHLLAVGSERHQASGQIYQAANLQVHVTAAGGVSGAGRITTPNHVAVTPLHTVPIQKAVIQSVSQRNTVGLQVFSKSWIFNQI